jgi:hypothetical protein
VKHLIYLPTAEMTADVLTKPLQGSMFFKHVSTIFGKEQQSIDNRIET